MGCGSAPKRDPALRRGMRFQLLKKAIFGEVLIGVDWEPAKLKTAKQLDLLGSDLVGARSGAHLHNTDQI